MARAWITDRWVKDATVTLPDGTTTRLSPTGAQLKAISRLPEHFRTTRFGVGQRWAVSWYETVDGKQRQRTKKFPRRGDAEEFTASLEDDIRSDRYIDPQAKEAKFTTVAEDWHASKQRLKDSTWRRYRRELDNYIIPKWGTTPIGKITRPKIDAWVTELLAGTAPHVFDTRGHLKRKPRSQGPLKPSYVRHIVAKTFGGVMRYAMQEKILGSNPLQHVELPPDDVNLESDLPSLTFPEIEQLADAAAQITNRETDRVLLNLLSSSGPRIGEATALKIKDLDLNGARARIHRTWTVDKAGNRKLGPVKTWGKRWLPLASYVVDGLTTITKDRDPEEYVFVAQRGNVAIDGKNWYNRVWTKARTLTGLADGMSIHDLRHVAATNAIAAGADVKLVQQMLGHKDATETLNTYAHLWPDRVSDVIAMVEKNRAKALKEAAKKGISAA